MRKILGVFEVFLGVFEKTKEKKDRAGSTFWGSGVRHLCSRSGHGQHKILEESTPHADGGDKVQGNVDARFAASLPSQAPEIREFRAFLGLGPCPVDPCLP